MMQILGLNLSLQSALSPQAVVVYVCEFHIGFVKFQVDLALGEV